MEGESERGRGGVKVKKMQQSKRDTLCGERKKNKMENVRTREKPKLTRKSRAIVKIRIIQKQNE